MGCGECLSVPGHMTMSLYDKKLEKSHLQNQEADDLETWYIASGTQVLPMFSYKDPGLTMTIFMTGSNLFLNFCMGESLYSIEC